MHLDQNYWSSRYQSGDTPWDIGGPSPPLREYFNAIDNKNISILIPGAGRAYEARYLKEKGFTNVFICDWAPESLEGLTPHFPKDHLICEDFFKIESRYDLIVEQTFFCALHPSKRHDYINKVHELLSHNGRLVGLLFASNFPFEGPPFGGTEKEYRKLFQSHFDIEEIHLASNSIAPRLGNEIFFSMKKKLLK